MSQQIRESLSNRVYEDLANRIRTCEILPGQMVFEAELAAHYNVSKTPVREALQRLIEEGVVEKYARAGYVVNQIGIRDVQDGYHVRELLEGDAAYLAAKHMTDDEIQQLEALMLPDDRDKLANREANRTFHMLIAAASRNPRLCRMVRIVYDDVLRIMMMDPYLKSWGGMEEHHRICDAIRARNAEAARQAMIAHVQAGLQRILVRL